MPFAGAMAIAIAMAILLLAPCAEATSEGLMIEQILSDKGCGAFAGLVASTAGVAEVFRSFVEKAEAKTTDTFDVFGDKRARNAGLTIFCPDDEAVAAFVPRFNKLSADAQVALLLYHGVPSRRSEEALRLIDGEVPTLDKGPLPGSRSMLTIDVYEGIVVLYSPSPSVAAVTEMVVDHDRLAVYIIDNVMIPRVPEIGFQALLLFFGLLALGALVLVQVFFLFRDV